MLKKSMITAAAALAITIGATAFQASPAQAGVTIQLVHGSGYGFAPGWWGYPGYRGNYGNKHGYRRRAHGPRYGGDTYGSYYGGRPGCYTTYKKVKIKRWSDRKHRMVWKKIRRPVTICR